MAPMDALWFQEIEENHCIINGCIWIDDVVDIESNKRFIEEKFAGTDKNGKLKYPKLRSIPKPVWHRMVWLPCQNFDINDHVKLYDGPKPTNEHELQTILGKLSSVPMKKNKPQWQCIFIEMEGEKKTVAILRFHHGIGDGVSIVRMLIRELDQTLPTTAGPTKKKFAARSHKILEVIYTVLTAPAQAFKLLSLPYDNHALHGPRLSGNKLVSWTPDFDLDLVKAMKNAAGMTVNDILMSCVASTFQTYFRRHTSKTPSQITASVPVDLRFNLNPDDLTLDNQFSVVFLPLPLDKKNRLTTLKETRNRMNSIKKSTEPLVNAWTSKYIMERLPTWLSRHLFDDTSDRACMVLSNVPGPQHALTINNQTIHRVVFWPPCRSTIGMAVSVHSYMGKVSMGFMVDKMIMSNPGLITSMFMQEFHALAKDLDVPVPE